MGLKIGGTAIAAAYLGSTALVKAYHGEDLVLQPPNPDVNVTRAGVDLSGGEVLTHNWPGSGGPTDGKKCTLALWIEPQANNTDILYGTAFGADALYVVNNGNQLLIRDGAGNVLLSKNSFFTNNVKHYVMIVIDTTQGTAANRMRVWKGTSGQSGAAAEITSWTADGRSNIAQNSTTPLTKNSMQFGLATSAVLGNFDGIMADVNLVDGVAITDPDTFAKDWGGGDGLLPREPQGVAYGLRGFHHTFANTSDMGADVSGSGNAGTLSSIDGADQVVPYL